MIEKLQKISVEIFRSSIKTYTLKDIIIHKKAHVHNLTQMLSLYPNKGVGFYVKRKTWNNGMDILIHRTQYKSIRKGNLFGQKRIEDKFIDEYPKKLAGASKRGQWQFELGEFKQYRTDNDVVYTRQDYEAFLKMRGIGVSLQPNVKPEENQQEEQNAEEQPQQ